MISFFGSEVALEIHTCQSTASCLNAYCSTGSPSTVPPPMCSALRIAVLGALSVPHRNMSANGISMP
ncbi:hypothetical protein D3C86_2146000 [compost metagenome]